MTSILQNSQINANAGNAKRDFVLIPRLVCSLVSEGRASCCSKETIVSTFSKERMRKLREPEFWLSNRALPSARSHRCKAPEARLGDKLVSQGRMHASEAGTLTPQNNPHSRNDKILRAIFHVLISFTLRLAIETTAMRR